MVAGVDEVERSVSLEMRSGVLQEGLKVTQGDGRSFMKRKCDLGSTTFTLINLSLSCFYASDRGRQLAIRTFSDREEEYFYASQFLKLFRTKFRAFY